MAKSPSVPLLEFTNDKSTEPKKKESRNQYNTLKFGAGYKPRCSDLERWHLYKVNEVQFHSNHSCPFNFSNQTEEKESVIESTVSFITIIHFSSFK